jgi:hypothetical protein
MTRIRAARVAADHLVAGSRFDLRAYFGSLKERPACRELLGVLSTGEPAAWASAAAAQDWVSRLGDLQFAKRITSAMTRSRARYLYRHHSNRGKQYDDFCCLTPIGVRVGYASPILLKTLPRREQAALHGRVGWASTSNPHDALHGVRAGQSITTASQRLDMEPPIHIGRTTGTSRVSRATSPC